ncbi:unnamed protein product [Cylindrotheca closterium]|uniref:SGNH hydrolase-type esterase domain-containing protein n=1 Tax=Cylindrotheca closterium TaxID=2856 RepID=A0AAD2G0U6_9STRA|nr:unnamed protein product [Cylindrotheca closterium]
MKSKKSCRFAAVAQCICLLLSAQTAFASEVMGWSKSGEYQNVNNSNNSKNNDGFYFSESSPTGDALFMVGNSYVSTNNLTDIIKNMLDHSSFSSSASLGVNLPLITETFDKGGAKWRDLTFDPANFTATLHAHEYRWVVLQEQSETPGLYDSMYQSEFSDSKTSVKTLDNLIRHIGSAQGTTNTILFQTWGRLHHDDNPTPEIQALFDSFLHHQYRIAVGYREYQKFISTPERPVLIAPVGYAFQAIHDGMEAEGLDPEQEGGRFSNLYIEDGSHPSEQGSYLAASVLVGILTGQDPRQFDWDYPLVPQDIQKYLRDVAHATISNFCQTCNVTPNKMPYISPEEQAAMDARRRSSSFFTKFLHFVFWCGVIGGGGFLAMVKRERLRLAWRRQLVRNAWGRSSTVSSTGNSFGYAPLSQTVGADMELI